MAQQYLDLELGKDFKYRTEDLPSFYSEEEVYLHKNPLPFGTSKHRWTMQGGGKGFCETPVFKVDDAICVYYEDFFSPEDLILYKESEVNSDHPVANGSALIGCTESCKCSVKVFQSSHFFINCSNQFCVNAFSSFHFGEKSRFYENHACKGLPLFCSRDCYESRASIQLVGFNTLPQSFFEVPTFITFDDLLRFIAHESHSDPSIFNPVLYYQGQQLNFSGDTTIASALVDSFVINNNLQQSMQEAAKQLDAEANGYSLAQLYIRAHAVGILDLGDFEIDTFYLVNLVEKVEEVPDVDCDDILMEECDAILDLIPPKRDLEEEFFERFPADTQNARTFRLSPTHLEGYSLLPKELRLELDAVVESGDVRLCRFSAPEWLDWDDVCNENMLSGDICYWILIFDDLISTLKQNNLALQSFTLADLAFDEIELKFAPTVGVCRIEEVENAKWYKEAKYVFEYHIRRFDVSSKRRKCSD